MAKGEVRAQMVATATRLLAEHGPAGASIGDVLKASGASRGSTYHHFPDGKRELYAAALDLAGQRAYAALEEARGAPADEVVARFFAMWRTLLTRTDLKVGCAVLSVAVSGDAESVEHAGRVFRAWRDHLDSLLVDGGLTPARASSLATLALTSAEGAVAIARAEHDLTVFETVAEQMVALARRPA